MYFCWWDVNVFTKTSFFHGPVERNLPSLTRCSAEVVALFWGLFGVFRARDPKHRPKVDDSVSTGTQDSSADGNRSDFPDLDVAGEPTVLVSQLFGNDGNLCSGDLFFKGGCVIGAVFKACTSRVSQLFW